MTEWYEHTGLSYLLLIHDVTAWAIPRALWAAPGGAAGYNQLWRALNNKPFQCSNGRDSPQRRRTAARVEQGDLFKFYARSRSLISAHLLRYQRWLSQNYLNVLLINPAYLEWQSAIFRQLWWVRLMRFRKIVMVGKSVSDYFWGTEITFEDIHIPAANPSLATGSWTARKKGWIHFEINSGNVLLTGS